MQSTTNEVKKLVPVVFRIIFVRHGETAQNKEMRLQGQIDVPLNNTGEAQAKEAGVALKNVKFNRVYSSDLCRAHKTCELILQQNLCDPPAINVLQKIRERNFGVGEGKSIEEYRKMAETEGRSWPNYTPEGAETIGEVSARITAFFKEVCQSVFDKHQAKPNPGTNIECNESSETLDPDECVLVVSHGGALRELYVHLHKTLGTLFPHGNEDKLLKICPNTGISEYVIKYAPKIYEVKCVRFHDGDHLLRVN